MKNLYVIPLLYLLSLSVLSAQPYTIQGKVVDVNSGEPLIGVNILEKGTSNGTISDFSGKFTFEIRQECAALQVSYTGYSSKTVQDACAGDTLKIQLEASMQLQEVVVTKRKSRRKRKRKQKAEYSNPQFFSADHIAPQRPADWNTEDYGLIEENRFLRVRQKPRSTFSIDVDAASYSNMRRFLNNGQQPPKDAIRIEELVNYFTYDYPAPQEEAPFEVIAELSECPWQPQHQLLHIGLQGKKIPTAELPPSNLVFLVDVSGSMNRPNKLPLLKSSLKLLTEQLREQDRVSIVVYAGAARLVLEPTAGNEKEKIIAALNRLQAGGSTAGGAGIQLAYKIARERFMEGGNNRVILSTDGDFNIGQSSDAALVRMIEKERESGVFLTVMGFGTGNYKGNKMQQLANKGNGNHAYIDNMEEARKVLVSEFGGTMFTIAKDVKLQIEFNPAQVQAYRLIGYENRLLDEEDFNDDTKDAGELGAGHTVTALYEIIPPGIESEFLADVDELKYQKGNRRKLLGNKSECCTVKLRYKAPDGNTSQKRVQPVPAQPVPLAESSDNFRWSAAVASFGMLLRDSKFKGQADYKQVKKMAQAAKGADADGYRAGFIELIGKARKLPAGSTADR